MESVSLVRLPDWELKCLYNHSELECQLKAGRLIEDIQEGNLTTARYKQREGTVTEVVFYLDAITRDQVAEFSQFKHKDGTLGASGKRDPKWIILNGIEYRRLRGPDHVARDLTKLFPEVFPVYYLSIVYGWYRNRLCRLYGPEQDAVWGAKADPAIRILFFFFDAYRLKKFFSSPVGWFRAILGRSGNK